MDSNRYAFQRACEVIESINLDVMTPEEAIKYAKALASRARIKYAALSKEPQAR